MDRILIIDDDETTRRVTSRFLRKHGFEVEAAADGVEGLRLAAAKRPDLVLCDLVMPNLGGEEVLSVLRRDERLADIPFVFMTGLSAPEDVRQGMNQGADDYLVKPVEAGELLNAVRARLARRSQERGRQERQMERAMELFAGMVHDLRNPLSVVLGYTDLLRTEASSPSSAEAGTSPIFERMQAACVRMQAILSETLFLARSRTGRLSFDPSPFDLREFCLQLLSEHEGSNRLRFTSAAGEYRLVSDPLRLRQVVENLVSNALKYSDGTVELTLTGQAEGYQVRVSDQGIGIPPGESESVFEPFFRASNAQGKPGHGLGLSIARSCLEPQGGSLHFVSVVGQGTTFVLDIPRTPRARMEPVQGASASASSESHRPTVQPPARTTDAPEQRAELSAAGSVASVVRPTEPACEGGAETGPGSESRVATLGGIIVDDDSVVRSLLCDLLEGLEGVVVLGEAATLSQARALVRQHDPQVVFLDINLPEGLGFELLPDLPPNTAVVFVTSAEEFAVHAFDCEAADYLLKPVNRERLEKALGRVRRRLGLDAVLPAAEAAARNDTFLVKTLAEKKLVKIQSIKNIVAYGEYSWVYWENSKGALLRKALRQWESELPSDRFVRVHRNAIVNLEFMERLERLPSGRLQIRLRDTPEPIMVSLRLAPALNRKLKELGG
jgi:signal transduction histidine kinase